MSSEKVPAPQAKAGPAIKDEGDDVNFQGWKACADAMRDFDEHLIKGWKEEIDTLLLLVSVHIIESNRQVQTGCTMLRLVYSLPC
jgi:hypothetical protein